MAADESGEAWEKIMKATLAGLVVLGSVIWSVSGDPPAPEGMVCRQVTVVRFHAGPNWDDFGKHVAEHLDCLREQMKSGKLLHAGPLVDGTGGISIYSVTDLQEVDALVSADPLVQRKICTYSMQSWRMCSPAPE